jgi:hypothetical protein
MKNKEKTFEIKGTFEISLMVVARNRKEAKAFAEEQMPELVSVDTNQLNDVLRNYIKQVKKPKVFEVVNVDQEQGE